MKETSKAMRRRVAELKFGQFQWDDVFKGHGVDVGSGDDSLRDCKYVISDSDKALSHDLPDGGGDFITAFFKEQEFDFIHASQVLEHALNPVRMLFSWLKCLKPGGYIVATVPDWKLYEKCVWPSQWNAGHRSTWSLDSPVWAITGYDPEKNASRIHCKLPEWLEQFNSCEVLLCRLVDTNYDYTLGPDVDQTFDADQNVECFIEFVLKRK
jgi:SAM-dependent methyltransferase